MSFLCDKLYILVHGQLLLSFCILLSVNKFVSPEKKKIGVKLIE